jgi:hypothetical protein
VTPSGMLPLASYPTDLARPADPTPVIGSTRPFSYRSAGQRYLIMVNAVYTSSSSTTIAWTILSMEAGRGLQAASTPPFADAAPPHRAYNPISAGGPQIKIGAGRSAWRARLITTKLAGFGALECLCSDLRFGAAALRRTGQQMHVITNLPPLPAGTSRVDVVLPGLTTFIDLAVTPVPDSTFRSAGPAVRVTGFWAYQAEHPHPGCQNTGLADAVAAGRPATALPGDGGHDCALVPAPGIQHISPPPRRRLAAFSSVNIRPGFPPSSALRVDAARRLATTGIHLDDGPMHRIPAARH